MVLEGRVPDLELVLVAGARFDLLPGVVEGTGVVLPLNQSISIELLLFARGRGGRPAVEVVPRQ